MLAQINPVALPALRIAGTIFLIINLIGGVYLFRNRRRFFAQDPNVDNDPRSARPKGSQFKRTGWVAQPFRFTRFRDRFRRI